MAFEKLIFSVVGVIKIDKFFFSNLISEVFIETMINCYVLCSWSRSLRPSNDILCFLHSQTIIT